MGSVLGLARSVNLAGADPQGNRVAGDDGPDGEVLIVESVAHVPEERIGCALCCLGVTLHGDGVAERECLTLFERLERGDDRGLVVGERLGLAASAGAGDGGDFGGLNLECHGGRPFNLAARAFPLPMTQLYTLRRSWWVVGSYSMCDVAHILRVLIQYARARGRAGARDCTVCD